MKGPGPPDLNTGSVSENEVTESEIIKDKVLEFLKHVTRIFAQEIEPH